MASEIALVGLGVIIGFLVGTVAKCLRNEIGIAAFAYAF